jgi:hypothetical protein
MAVLGAVPEIGIPFLRRHKGPSQLKDKLAVVFGHFSFHFRCPLSYVFRLYYL